MNTVFYLLDAMRLLSGKSLEEIRENTFKIGMLEQYGQDEAPLEMHARPAGATVHHVHQACRGSRREGIADWTWARIEGGGSG